MTAVPAQPPSLRCIHGLDSGMVYEIVSEKVTIGRNPDCQLRLGADDDGRRVSRRHASIQRVGNDFQLLDLESRNGTMHNGAKMTPYVPVVLEHGDRIQICEFEFLYERKSESSDGQSSAHVMLIDGGASSYLSSIDSSAGWQEQTSLNSETKLRAILQLVRNLQGTVGTASVLRQILESLLQIFPAYDLAVALVYGGSSEPVTISCCQPDEQLPEVTRISRSIVEHVMERKEAVVSQDLLNDRRFDGESILALPWRSVMCVPLFDSANNAVGVLQLQSSRVTQDDCYADLDLFATVAVTVSQAVETNRLLEATALQREFVKELEIAQRIQFALLPRTSPELDGYSFYEYYSPFQYIGGDYYDYIPISDGRLAIVLADVQGHGIPSALVMTKLSGEIKIRLAENMPIAEVVKSTNDTLIASGVDRFVTMLLLVLDPATGNMEFINAGHPYPMIVDKNGKVRIIDGEGGLPVGMMPDQEYPLRSGRLKPGELILVYTDGITEAMNGDEMYGNQRLISTCGGCFESNGENVVQSVLDFQGEEQADDMCLVSIRRD